MSMTKKRTILEKLTADELRASVEHYDLQVDDRRIKTQLIDALAHARKARLDEVLYALARPRLKAMCRAFDLDDAGRKKTDLVTRLVGPAAVSKGHGGTGMPTRFVANAPASPAEMLRSRELRHYLWRAANILDESLHQLGGANLPWSASIDHTAPWIYGFGLLFLKRLSDRFDEEEEERIAKGISEKVAWTDHPYMHQFFVPNQAPWSAIRKRTANLGEASNTACAVLEEQNRALEGILTSIDYTDESKLGYARESVLADMIRLFSQVSLRNDRMAEADLLSDAYEDLLKRCDDDAGREAGEFYTPRMIVKLMVELLAPTEQMRICDPTAGSGGMLIECAKYIERQGGNPRNLLLHGQENNRSAWARCKMNMLIHGLPEARIEFGDTILGPKLVDEGGLLLYDRVIANPPFNPYLWGRDVVESDAFGRFRFGLPPETKGNLAFVQHMVAMLNATGRLGVVMPHGILFRGGAEGRTRKGLLQEDLFEAVIGLAPNLVHGTRIQASILVLNRNKPAARKGRVLFIDASAEFEEGRNQNHLRSQDIEHISGTFHAYADVEKYARVVPLAEVEQNDRNLNISYYVDT